MDKDKYGSDKILHILACLFISFMSTEAGIGAALAKEYGDSKAYGNHWCWWDICADVLGIIAGTLLRIATIGKFYWI